MLLSCQCSVFDPINEGGQIDSEEENVMPMALSRFRRLLVSP